MSGPAGMDAEPRDVVGEWDHWRIVVNFSQNYLGKVMLVIRRHETDVTRLTETKQRELWRLLRSTKESLTALFQPDHFNYCFLMNADRDVHLHMIPRYAASREFAGQVFTDGRLGEHYQLTRNIVPVRVREKIANALRLHGLRPDEKTHARKQSKGQP